MPTIGFEIKRKCKVCGKVFVAKTLDSHYCSPKCGKVAWKRKKDAKDKSARLEAIARQIPDIREYISVKEAVAMFGVERNTLYRLIKSGRIPAVNIGTRLIRIKRSDMENLFLTRPESIAEKERPFPNFTVWSRRTVIPLLRFVRNIISMTVPYGRRSENTPLIPTNRELCICTQTRNR